MPSNDKKKQAKARRDAIAEKLKQIASTTIVHTKQDKLEEDEKAVSKEEIEAKFVPIAEDDAVSRKVEKKLIVVTDATTNNNSKVNNDDDDAAMTTTNNDNQSNNNADPKISHLLALQGNNNNKQKAGHQQQQLSLSNRQRKEQERPPVSYLKSLLFHSNNATTTTTTTNRDDLVDLADVTSNDPEFLMLLKDARNTVPVPIHWRQKSSFMSHTVDRDANTTFESSVMPEWVARMNIASAWNRRDYDIMNLFLPFVAGHPTPDVSPYGDLFFEGKDMRARIRGFKPGQLSQRLRHALDMGSASSNNNNSNNMPTMPPPWLTGMQRVVRLPPSYPNIKIPGVNYPIPSGARWGRGKNEWGDPPRDANNNYVYDGISRGDAKSMNTEEQKFVSASCWGTNNNNNNSTSSSSSSDYISIFTAPKEDIEAEKRRREEQELKEREMQELQMQQTLSQQQPNNNYNNQYNNNHPSVVVPQHMLHAAGLTGGGGGAAYPQQQGQFGTEVNTQQNQPGMGLYNNYYNSV